MHACGCAHNRRQETDVLIVSVLFAVVVNLALRSNAQGRITVVGMRKLTIVVGLGAFPISVMGDPQIEDEVWVAWILEGLLSSVLVRPGRQPLGLLVLEANRSGL